MCASARLDGRPVPASTRARRKVPPVLAAAIVLCGLIAVAVRLDAPGDGTSVTGWRADGVVLAVDQAAASALNDGDLVTTIDGRALTRGPAGAAWPDLGQSLRYQLERNGEALDVPVRMVPTELAPLVSRGWGNLLFVGALAALAAALHLRRPDEPSTAPLLIAAACLLGSTLPFTTGVPATAAAYGGPVLWLYLVNTMVVFVGAFGALVLFTLRIGTRWSWARSPRLTGALYAVGPVAMLAWMAVAWPIADGWTGWVALAAVGQTALQAVLSLATGAVGVIGYVRTADPVARSRLRWIAAGGAVTVATGLAGWHLPSLVSGAPLLPPGALGLSGLPFVIGIAVALRRHRLFDIERLANRSLVAIGLVATLAAGYALLVAALVSWLNISRPLAAAIAAAAAALAVAPLYALAQRSVNRLMYGDRDDPAAVLARLGSRLQSAMLPADVPPAVVDAIAQSLRLPYAAVDLADERGGFRVAAERGHPRGQLHEEILTQQGSVVGRLRVSDRGTDDPLDAADLALIGSLAREVGPAIQAVVLHEDLLRSRAEVVALREDERRRLRRDLHDGLGPTLAAIGLKAALADRALPPGSPAHALLSQISTEVKDGLEDIRRLVEALRPPALDELGVGGALRSRAASLSGTMTVEVRCDDATRGLPAATETAAYRIAVEAMTNAVRHSGGSRCDAAIAIRDGALVLTVRDDGRGLADSRTPGVGLRSMRERAAEVGGTLEVTSDQSGTLVAARLPLDLGVPA